MGMLGVASAFIRAHEKERRLSELADNQLFLFLCSSSERGERGMPLRGMCGVRGRGSVDVCRLSRVAAVSVATGRRSPGT